MIKGQTKRIGIYGRSGCGKSTLAKQLMKDIDRLVVYDTLCEYEEQGCKVARSIVQLLKLARQRRFKIAYQPAIDACHEKELRKVAEALLLIQKPYQEGKIYPQITLLIEEMSLAIPNKTGGDVQIMQNLANMGRHYGINLIGIAQRPANVNATFRGSLTEQYFFNLVEPLDVDEVAKKIGRENAELLRRLPNHQAFRYSDGKIENHINTL